MQRGAESSKMEIRQATCRKRVAAEPEHGEEPRVVRQPCGTVDAAYTVA
jgi:hypothetical protein